MRCTLLFARLVKITLTILPLGSMLFRTCCEYILRFSLMPKVNLAAVHEGASGIPIVGRIIPRLVLVQFVHVILLQLLRVIHFGGSICRAALLCLLPLIYTLHVICRILTS